LIKPYFNRLLKIIDESPITRIPDLTLDQRSASVGFIRGEVLCIDGSQLYFRELVDLRKEPIRIMYAYHYQGEDKETIFRYDNTQHFPALPNSPHHKHIADDVIPVTENLPSLESVLDEIADLISF